MDSWAYNGAMMNGTIQKKKDSLSDFQGLLFVFEVGDDFCSRARAGRHPPISSIYLAAAWSIDLYLYTQMY